MVPTPTLSAVQTLLRRLNSWLADEEANCFGSVDKVLHGGLA